MTDFRTLCAEQAENVRYLLNCIADGDSDPVAIAECVQHLGFTRAALAQPEGEGLTEDQLDVMVIAIQALIPSPNPWDTHSLAAVDRGREILQRAFARWGRPVVSAVEPIPVSERLPEDADCLVSKHGSRYCWLGVEVMHGGRALLAWNWKLFPLTIEQRDRLLYYWLPASTRFLPTTVDPARVT